MNPVRSEREREFLQRYSAQLALRVVRCPGSVSEIARRLGVHRNTVDRWCSGTHLPSIFWHKELRSVIEQMELESAAARGPQMHMPLAARRVA